MQKEARLSTQNRDRINCHCILDLLMFALKVIPPITPYWLTMSHIIPFPHSHIIYNCLVVQIFLFFAHIQLQIVLKGRNYHPLLENLDFSGTEPPLDLRPVCKFKFVRCGPGEENQSSLSFSVEAWRPDEVREHLFPNSKIEIFIDFC